MEAIHSSEMSVNKISTQRQIPEGGILQNRSYRIGYENLRSSHVTEDRVQWRSHCNIIMSFKKGFFIISFRTLLSEFRVLCYVASVMPCLSGQNQL
jgi:hypothetical protein